MGFRDSSLITSPSQDRRWDVLILDGSLTLFLKRRHTAHAIYYSSGKDSSTRKGIKATGMIRPGGKGGGGGSDRGQTSPRSYYLSPISLGGGGGILSSDSQYHPIIRIQASFTRGRSDARRASTSTYIPSNVTPLTIVVTLWNTMDIKWTIRGLLDGWVIIFHNNNRFYWQVLFIKVDIFAVSLTCYG